LRKFVTFALLEELSRLILSQGENLIDTHSVCWQQASRLTDSIKHDIDLLFETNCFVTDTRFILEDSSYRQGANVAKLELRFQGDDQLTIIAECLIDLNRILLRVKNRPDSIQLGYVADRIESGYNSEFVADIKQIK
jgi:hypothetical protein